MCFNVSIMSNQSYITKSLSDRSCCQYVLTSPRLYKIIVCKLYNLYYIYTCNSWGKLSYSNEAFYSTLFIRSWPVLMSVHILAMCVERQLLTIVNLYYMFYLFRHFQFMGKIGYSNGEIYTTLFIKSPVETYALGCVFKESYSEVQIYTTCSIS